MAETDATFSPTESNRRTVAIAILLIGFGQATPKVGVKAITSGVSAAQVTVTGDRYVTAKALSLGVEPATELDKLVGVPPNQVFEVSIDLGNAPLQTREGVDVVFYVEYVADRLETP